MSPKMNTSPRGRLGFAGAAMALLFLLLPMTCPARALEFTLDANPVDRGGVVSILVRPDPGMTDLKGWFNKKPVIFIPQKGDWAGLAGAGVYMKPGAYRLSLTWKENGRRFRRAMTVQVRDRDYGTRIINVDRRLVHLSKEDLARAARERKLVNAALSVRSPKRLWSGAFLRPTPHKIISAFGRKSVINGKLSKSVHTGVDLNSPTGTPVRAPAAGVVLLAGFHFFAGGSVYLDHGQGLITMYFHLSKIRVEKGQSIQKGQTLGLVGATGRVTGPHLHYGLYLYRSRVDPLIFHKITQRPGFDTLPPPSGSERERMPARPAEGK